jgi:phosphoribosylaminoimidazolecarboxamide formyltransferase/IMP cyclohydrolase
VSDYTGFPELFDGRVKTLHPKVHGGLLQRRDNDQDKRDAKKHEIPTIDLDRHQPLSLLSKPSPRRTSLLDEAIENIDIGGPSMLRSAAKNHRWVTVISDPDDYDRVLQEMRDNETDTTLSTREHVSPGRSSSAPRPTITPSPAS